MHSAARFGGRRDCFGLLFNGFRCAGHSGIVILDTQKYVRDLSVSVIL